ncbi:hypothetical protein FGB62_5g524 [Gracilaria domingensis]|nr:hypothetical protein FGB62_5g524 [Gracilaria domingensis]
MDNSQNAFLIRIKGGTRFRGTNPYIITCLDNDLSTELHRTRAVDGGRYVAWNEAFVIDISEYCKEKQPTYLTFVFVDASKTGVSSLGYVQLELRNIRNSELEEVTEDIRDGKGTITFSTMPVEQPSSALSEYAAKIKGYFAGVFHGTNSSESSDGSSSQPETVYGRTLGAVKGVAASAVGVANAKLNPSESDEQEKSEIAGNGNDGGSSSQSPLEGLQHMIHSKVEQAREGIAHAVDKVKPTDKPEAEVGDATASASAAAAGAAAAVAGAGAAAAAAGAGAAAAADAGAAEASTAAAAANESATATRSPSPSRLDALQETLQSKVQQAKAGFSEAVEKVKAGDKLEGEAVDATVGTSAATEGSASPSRLSGLQEMVQTKVGQAREGFSHAVEKVKSGDKAEAGPSEEAAGAGAAATASATSPRLSGLQDLVHSKVEQAKEGISHVAEKVKGAEKPVGEEAGAAGDGATGAASPSRLGGLQDMIHSRVEQAKEGLSHAVEKVKPAEKPEGEISEATADAGTPGSAAQGSAQSSRLGGLQDKLYSKAGQAKEGISHAVEKVTPGDKANDSAWPAEGSSATEAAPGPQSPLQTMGDMLNSTVQQTREGLANLMGRMRLGDQSGAAGNNAEGGTATKP